MMTERIKELHSNIQISTCPKKHRQGLDKAISPAETVKNVNKLFKRIDLDLVKEITRIDSGRLDIPVYVCEAGKDCNTPTRRSMGKGPTPDQSAASALMELVERFSHANFPTKDKILWGTLDETNDRCLSIESLFWLPDRASQTSGDGQAEFKNLPFSWIPAYSLVTQKDVMIPYEWFADIFGTNGLSAGNTLAETILQGLCEVVERHVSGIVNMAKKPVPVIDLNSVTDETANELIEKFNRNGIRLVCMDFSLDTGIPTVGGIAYDPATFPNSEIVFCAGTATNPEKALIRTITEIQQMAVDYFRADYYAGGILPKFNHFREFEYLFDENDAIPIQALPDVSADDMADEIKSCADALSQIGLFPLVVDISHATLKIPAVFVVVPGAAQYENLFYRLNAAYHLGRRLMHLGRFDDAINKFKSSIDAFPQSSLHCIYQTAECLKYQQKWQEAIAVYKNSLRHGPDRAMQYRIFHSISVCSDHLKKAPFA